MKELDQRTDVAARALPSNAAFGPWEGGLPLNQQPAARHHTPSPLRVLAWNIQGALGASGGFETHTRRLQLLTTALHQTRAVIAVLSEPRFGPGMQWPQWTGYEYRGCRSKAPDTVAVLVLRDFAASVLQVEDVGNERAIWSHVLPARSGVGVSLGFLLLAVYAPPPNHEPHERAQFFQDRATELQKLRNTARFSNLPCAMIGDLNFHMDSVCSKNRELARPVDRVILNILIRSSGMNVVPFNPDGISTHSSGSVLDYCFCSRGLNPLVEVLPSEGFSLRSDHRALLVTGLGALDQDATNSVGRTCWQTHCGAWDEALLKIPRAIEFVNFWVSCALQDTFLRDSVVSGKWRKLRQAIVDKAVWWRSVLLCVAGHLAGLAVTVKPHKAAAVPFELLLSQWHGLREESKEAEGVDSDLRLADGAANVARFLSTHAVNPGKAQAILSNLLRPKLPLRLGLLDDSTGLSLSDSAVVQLLTDEVRIRPVTGMRRSMMQ